MQKLETLDLTPVSKVTCHGCEGKGWIAVTIRETTMPFLDGRAVVAGASRITRDCEVQTCPVCRGKGVLAKSEATIGEHISG